jgi:hypothetical protein
MLFQTMIVVGSGDLSEPNSTFGVNSAEYMVKGQQLTHSNVIRGRRRRQEAGPVADRLQLAATTRLSIPVALSTDPRNHFTENVGTAAACPLSQWPETLGLAAIGSAELVPRPLVRRGSGGNALEVPLEVGTVECHQVFRTGFLTMREATGRRSSGLWDSTRGCSRVTVPLRR